jgi:acetyltransferase
VTTASHSVKVRGSNRNLEHIARMNTHYLASLFTPDSVVLFGASDRTDSVGGVVFKNLLTSGFKGRIYAINPRRDEVQGQRAFSSLDEIDATPDLAVVATPAQSIPGIVEACGERGIRMMLILSAGFRETGAAGRRLEDRVTQLVKRYGIRLMGPNCLGIIRPDKGLNITFGNNNARPGNLAFVSQSGAICTAILDWASRPWCQPASAPIWISETTWIIWSRTQRPSPSCSILKASITRGDL